MQLNSLSIPGCRNIIITITTIKMHQIRPPITFSCLWLHVKVPTLKCLKLNKNFEFPLNESSPYSSVLPLTWTWDLPLLERPPWFWMNATEYSGPLPSPLEYCNRPRPFVSHFLKKIWRNNLNECNGIFRSPHLQYCNRPFPFVWHYLYLFEEEM